MGFLVVLFCLASCVCISVSSQFSTTEYETPALIKCFNPIHSINKNSTILDEYTKGNNIKGAQTREWCIDKLQTHKISMGRSYGTMKRPDQKLWEISKCAEMIKLGKMQTCEERYGWSYLKQWRSKLIHVIRPSTNMESTSSTPTSTTPYQDSDVKCIEELKTPTFCKMKNVLVDFSRMNTGHSSRSFDPGFLQTYGNLIDSTGRGGRGGKSYKPQDVGGKIHREGKRVEHPDTACNEIETRPTFVMSNDDIFNLGHYMNDVMAVWVASVLASIDTKNAMLLNIDGIRRRGPASTEAHRIMDKESPDSHGPYAGYYDSWFDKQERGVTYNKNEILDFFFRMDSMDVYSYSFFLDSVNYRHWNYMDTSNHRGGDYNPVKFLPVSYNDLGNIGSAQENQVFEPN